MIQHLCYVHWFPCDQHISEVFLYSMRFTLRLSNYFVQSSLIPRTCGLGMRLSAVNTDYTHKVRKTVYNV